MLLDKRAHVVFANPQAEALLASSQALRVKGGRLTACHATADAALQAALAPSLRSAGDAHPGVVDLALLRPGQRPLAVSVVPVSQRVTDRLDAGRRVAAMILVADPQMRRSLRLEGFMQACGLTPAEGRVLAAIVEGDGLERIAGRLGVGRATVKTHLNRILAKTGTTRQHALVRLVAASGLPSLGQRGILPD
ncbi:helix-turn-helix transcriptional regulator [Vineibacter terrae]|uniref:Helix-turn-helix transcriptional regulator n=2 Tax=Vineibacter terrae TaxID=2586908 RepID=A0A5C8PKP8_9HYPH|nr:helix-turn-helix transcriptional regulator [Vineibacter terrae]